MLCSLIGQAPALLLSKPRDIRACDCTVSVFLDLSDSMKVMVKYGLDQSEATWNQVSGYVCIGKRTGQSV